MTTIAIAIVGAGPGLGAATARRFASEGFEVALVSRSRERVDALAAQLTDAGVRRGATSPTQGMQRLWRPRWVRLPTPREPWRWCSTALAERVWSMHTDRAGFRHFADDLDA